MCKQIITLADGSTRPCRAPEMGDGWCRVHHPDTIELELVESIRAAQNETRRIEDRQVGRWLRTKHPDLFERMLDEMKRAIPSKGNLFL